MEDQRKQAFDFARDTTKQLITLGTGIIALTVTFSKNVFGTPNAFQQVLLVISWLAFLVSVMLGVWTLLALTGTLEPKKGASNGEDGQEEKKSSRDPEASDPSIRGSNVTTPSFLQIFFFVVGLLFTVCFGIASLVGG